VADPSKTKNGAGTRVRKLTADIAIAVRWGNADAERKARKELDLERAKQLARQAAALRASARSR